MPNEAIKAKIQKLIDKYEVVASSGQLRRYSEEDTKKDFILPLFALLGWDIRDRQEVAAEEFQSGGRVDYGFYLNGRIAFLLEAKKLSANLYQEEFTHQAIRYAWNKAVTWAVLTDFEGIKVLNAQDIKRSLVDKQLFNISYKEYVSRFEDLWLLSKESFLKNKLDTYAEKVGKKYQRIPISETLYKDLNECREILTKSLAACNPGVKPDDLDEGIQKLLDRLMFLRVAEDRNVELNILRQLLRDAEHAENGSLLYEAMTSKFRDLDKVYDSNLFSEHPFEKWEEFGGATKKVIEKLYGKKGYYEYDFKVMPADVLGTVYEHYLAHRLSKSKKGITLDKDAKKRKEQGIYYTPTFVVDYIVHHTLQPVLDKCKTYQDLLKIKVLDPACGSGSFLMKALEVLNEKYKQLGAPGGVSTKLLILTQNLYGVDLDEKAVDIARLNLLINSLEGKERMPLLTNNIKCGNSLISGTDKDLIKQFGRNFRKVKPFKWQEEFSEIFKQGGFDVVIGNPPYLKELDNKEAFEPIKKSNYEKYYQGKMDLWYFFLHRAMDVVKKSGTIGFITNSYFTKSSGSSKLIERIKNELVMNRAIDFDDIKIFGDVSGKHMIHIYTKKQSNPADKTCYIKVDKQNFADFIDDANCIYKPYQDIISSDYKIDFDVGENFEFENCASLGELFYVSQGVVEGPDKVNQKNADKYRLHKGDGVFVVSDGELNNLKLNDQENGFIKQYLDTKDIGRYAINFDGEYLLYLTKENCPNIMLYPHLKEHLEQFSQITKNRRETLKGSNEWFQLHWPREDRYFENPKLICKSMFLRPEFCFDDKKHYVGFSFSVIIQKEKNYNLKYLLGILNSRLGERWFNSRGKKRGVGVDIGVLVFRKFPVYKATPTQQKPIIELVDKILKLNVELKNVGTNSSEWERIEAEIEKTDKKIDEEAYKLYGLTPEEIKTIGNS